MVAAAATGLSDTFLAIQIPPPMTAIPARTISPAITSSTHTIGLTPLRGLGCIGADEGGIVAIGLTPVATIIQQESTAARAIIALEDLACPPPHATFA
jgi:hypothetical protein